MSNHSISVLDNYIVAGDVIPEEDSLFHMRPCLTKCSDGSFLFSTLIGKGKTSPDGRTKVFRSTDDCKTWEPVASPTAHDENEDPNAGFMMCNITEIEPEHLFAVYNQVDRSNPDEDLFHPQTDGSQHTEVRVTHSYDNGRTWEKPKPIQFTLPDLIMPGKCIILPDGSLGIPCEVWFEWDKGFQDGPSSPILLSHDKGETWAEAAYMAKDEKGETFFGDPRLTTLNDDTLVTLFWRYHLENGEDLPVHRAESKDNGRTWSVPESTELVGQIANPLFIKEGLMLCVYQKRFGDPSLRGVLSYDNGKSWDMDADTALWRKADDKDAIKNPFQGYQQYTFGFSRVLKNGPDEALISFWCSNGKTTYVQVLRVQVKTNA